MIITTVYGFGNVSISYEQMTYAGIIWFVLAGICFFFPAGLMMAEYGSAFHDAQGGIYSWLAGSIGEKWAFIGTFVWLANWVLWLVASASRLWISISALLFGKDTTQSWSIFGLHGTQLIGLLAILFMLLSTYLCSRGMTGIKIMSSIGGIFMILMNVIFILTSILILCLNRGQLAEPIHGISSFIVSPNKSFQTPITIISFVVYAVFAYGGMETVGGVINNMKKPEKEFPRGLIIGSLFTIISYVLMIFMTGFSVNYQQDILHGNANTEVFTNYKWTVALVVFVEIIVCTGIVFTIVEPILEGNYATAFWTGFGPVFFALIAWIFYEVSRRRNHIDE